MEIGQKEENGVVCIAIKGRTDTELVPELEAAINTIVADDKRRVLFDLGDLEYLRTSTLRVILKTVKQINQKNGKVALCSLNGYIREIFDYNCFQGTLTIADSVESGIQTLQKTLNAA